MSETDLDDQWPSLYIADRVLFVCYLVLVDGFLGGLMSETNLDDQWPPLYIADRLREFLQPWVGVVQ